MPPESHGKSLTNLSHGVRSKCELGIRDLNNHNYSVHWNGRMGPVLVLGFFWGGGGGGGGTHTFLVYFVWITNPCPNPLPTLNTLLSGKRGLQKLVHFFLARAAKIFFISIPVLGQILPEFCPSIHLIVDLSIFLSIQSTLPKSNPLGLKKYRIESNRWALEDAIDLVAYSEAPDLLQDIQY